MEWLLENWSVLGHAMLTTVILIVVMTFFVRINGLRSFAKMSSIDFVTTITIGSVINSTIMSDTNSLAKGALVVGLLLAIQTVFSVLKMRSNWFADLSENEPILLLKDGKFLEDNMRVSNVSKSDIVAKMREANALELDKVHAVILETTGDISVLYGDVKPDPEGILYYNVRF